MNPPELNNTNPQDDIPKFETTNSNFNANNNSNNNFSNGTQNLPNSVGALVLGILSIAFFWCYAVPSIIMAIIALVLASGCEREYNNNPGKYSLASYKNARAGKICAIIALSLVGLAIVVFVLILVFAGAALGGMRW